MLVQYPRLDQLYYALNKFGPMSGIGPGPMYNLGPGPMCHIGLAYNRQVRCLAGCLASCLSGSGDCGNKTSQPNWRLWLPNWAELGNITIVRCIMYISTNLQFIQSSFKVLAIQFDSSNLKLMFKVETMLLFPTGSLSKTFISLPKAQLGHTLIFFMICS